MSALCVYVHMIITALCYVIVCMYFVGMDKKEKKIWFRLSIYTVSTGVPARVGSGPISAQLVYNNILLLCSSKVNTRPGLCVLLRLNVSILKEHNGYRPVLGLTVPTTILGRAWDTDTAGNVQPVQTSSFYTYPSEALVESCPK